MSSLPRSPGNRAPADSHEHRKTRPIPAPPPPPPAVSSTPRLFLRFAGLAGAGWLLDAALLLGLVSLGVEARHANIVSSCTAALMVFLLSRQRIFNRASHRLAMRVVVYLVYTLCLIFVASFAIGWLVHWIAPLLESSFGPRPGFGRAAFVAAAVAKVVVTPPQLALNFLVSRFLSEKKMAPNA